VQNTGLTPLMIAVKENRLMVAERLLDMGANVNAVAKVYTQFCRCAVKVKGKKPVANEVIY